MIKYKKRGLIDHHRKEVVFLALRARSSALASLADVFEKNEKKNKTTSVYRLMLMQSRLMLPSLSLANLNVSCPKGEEPP